MKKKHLFIYIFILFLIDTTNGQITTEYISTNHLRDVKFPNPKIGIAVGNSGTILISNDSGMVWENVDSITAKTLRAIYFVNDSTGFIVGGDYNQNISEYEGVILKTNNYGYNWEITEDLLYESLFSIIFINDSVGYAIGKARYPVFGYRGLIKKTTDRGSTWVNKESGTNKPFYSIQFLNDETGYIVGISISLKTTDSGESWVDQTAGSGYYWPILFDLNFIDINSGFEFGHEIIRTTNGGENWESIGNQGTIQSVKYINDTEAIAVGNYGLFRVSTDGGMNWDAVDIGITNDLLAVDIPVRNKGYAVGQSGILVKFNIDSLDLVSSLVGGFVSIKRFNLYQNYPNPFNPSTRINYTIGSRHFVKLKVYNILGNEVAVLVNEEKSPGDYEVEFNGAGLPSGIYFYRLTLDNNSLTKKMILLK